MASNDWAKTRPLDNPYASIKLNDTEYRILKAYKSKISEDKDPYARWFMAIKSPYTFGSFDMGDMYINELPAEVRELRK